MRLICPACHSQQLGSEQRVEGQPGLLRCEGCRLRFELKRDGGGEGVMQLTAVMEAAAEDEEDDPRGTKAPSLPSPPEPRGTPLQREPTLRLVRALTRQRHETSVLFSLGQLQAAVAGAGADGGRAGDVFSSSTTGSERREPSGYIDVRAMVARMHARPEGNQDPQKDKVQFSDMLMSYGPFSSVAASAAFEVPARPAGAPAWLWGVLGMPVVVSVGLVLWALRTTTPGAAPTDRVAQPAQLAMTSATASAPAAAPARPTDVAATEPALVQARAEGPMQGRSDPASAVTPNGAVTGIAASPAAATVAAAMAAPAEELMGPPRPPAPVSRGHRTRHGAATAAPALARVERARPGQRKLDDADLLALLEPSTRPNHHEAARAPAPAPSGPTLPRQLSREDIQTEMRAVSHTIEACHSRYHASGTVVANTIILPNGRVGGVSIGGALARTPTGSCAAKAVREGRFAKFSGPKMSVSYPFVLK